MAFLKLFKIDVLSYSFESNKWVIKPFRPSAKTISPPLKITYIKCPKTYESFVWSKWRIDL
jgi:hypothetical protein